jgi:excinuclease ABC subunit B
MMLVKIAEGDYVTVSPEIEDPGEDLTPQQREKYIAELETSMRDAARKFEFEKAAQIRDKIKQLRIKDVAGIGIPA